MTEPTEDKYVTVDELAQRLGVSSRTIKRWTDEGLLPEPRRISQKWVRYNLRECMERIYANGREVTQ